jgi:hypothetical protein
MMKGGLRAAFFVVKPITGLNVVQRAPICEQQIGQMGF